MGKLLAFILIALSLGVPAAPLDAGEPDPPPLTIFYASTLSGFVRDLGRQFKASHPGVEFRAEASGSLDAIRKVTDLGRPGDIVLSADWRLLARPLRGLAPWVTVFAGNSMAILYADGSKYASTINAGNWYRILSRAGVRYGHSDPERDPEGYWTLIVWQLAERYYHQPGLAAKLEAGCPPANIRPASVNLISLIQSGELDYYFGYASDVKLGGLRAVLLPPEINLADFARSADYSSASASIGNGRTVREIRGAPIAYGATLTSAPPNRKAAIDFLRLVLGGPGRAAARRNGLVVYPQALADDPERRMPPQIAQLTRPLPLPHGQPIDMVSAVR